jgi:hypothetical protein
MLWSMARFSAAFGRLRDLLHDLGFPIDVDQSFCHTGLSFEHTSRSRLLAVFSDGLVLSMAAGFAQASKVYLALHEALVTP